MDVYQSSYTGAQIDAHFTDRKMHNYSGSNTRFDADSFGNTGGTNAQKQFIRRVSNYKNFTLTDASVSGQTVRQGITKIESEVAIPSAYDVHILNLGFDDAREYGNLSHIDLEIAHELQQICAYLRLQNIVDDTNTNISYSGSWSTVSIADSYGGNLHYTNTQGAYAQFQFTGDTLYIGTFYLASNGGTLEVKIDGTVEFSKVMSGESGQPYVSAPLIFEDLGTGSHVCRITNVASDGTKNIYFDWYGIPRINPPLIIVNGLTKMKTASYALYSPFNNANDTVITSANKSIRENLAIFGEKVIYIDQQDYDPNNYNLVDPVDLVHPTNLGHEWLASNILKRI